MVLKYTIAEPSFKGSRYSSLYHYSVFGDNKTHGMILIGDALASHRVFNHPVRVMVTNPRTGATSDWYDVGVFDQKASDGRRYVQWVRSHGRKYDGTLFRSAY